MAGKEGPPLDNREIQLVKVRDLARILSTVGVPTPLQERVMREVDINLLRPEHLTGVMVSNLDLVLASLPESEREDFERRAVEALKAGLGEAATTSLKDELREEVRDEVSEDVEKQYGNLLDIYLGEVVRRVWGFSLSELSAQEREQIIYIRKNLGIPGVFNPDGKPQKLPPFR